MKKLLLSIVAFAMCSTMCMAQNVPSNWAKLVGTVSASGSKGQAIIDHYATNANGEIFYSYVFYTDDGFEYAQYGEDEKFYGFPGSTKPNGNLNFGLNKIDRDGKLLFGLHSDRGYYDKGSCFMAGTPDGGAVITLKARLADEVADPDGKETLLRLHTTADASYEYVIEEPGIAKESGWQNRAYIIKLDNMGKVEWRKALKWESTPTAAGKSRSNMLLFGGVQVDAEGNIYTCGIFASPLTVEGNSKVYEPVIPANWNYDMVQKTAGSNFLLKLDKEGNYQWMMTSDQSKTMSSAKPMCLAADNEALYMYGKMEGDKGQVEKFGGKTLTMINEKMGMYVMKVNFAANAKASDETAVAEYASTLHTSAGGIKPMQINLGKDMMALTGGIKKTSLLDAEGKELLNVASSMYTGYVITLDKKTGAYLNSTGVSTLFESEGSHLVNDSIYVSGYAMGGLGRFVTMSQDLQVANTYDVIKSKGFLTNQGSVMVGNKVVMFNRSKTNFDFMGLPSLTARAGWDVLINGFTLPGMADDTPTGICNEVAADEFTVVATEGGIAIVTEVAQQVAVYNVMGMLVKQAEVKAGYTEMALPQGFYMVNGKKVLVR